MAKVIYEVVQHDGGWAYKVGDVLSETLPDPRRSPCRSGRRCRAAAPRRRDRGHRVRGQVRPLAQEIAEGTDRPDTELDD